MTRTADMIDVTNVSPSFGDMPGACQSGGCGCSGPAIPPPPAFGDVLMTGVEITPEAIAQEIQHHPAPDPQTAWVEAARALAVRELLVQEARRLGLHPASHPDETGRAETDDEALVRLVLEQEVAPEIATEGEQRRYYESNPQRFRTPDLFDAAHILIEPERQDDAAWDAAEAFARSIAAAVGDDQTAFAEATRTHSACAPAQQDGSLGQIRRGELVPAVQQAIEALKNGETAAEPVRSRFGWHVVRLNRHLPGRTLPFDAVRDRIGDMLEARSWSMLATRYVAALAARGTVEGIVVGAVED